MNPSGVKHSGSKTVPHSDFRAGTTSEDPCKVYKNRDTYLGNVELHNLYRNADIIKTLKSRRLRWAGHVARMGDGRRAHKILLGKPEGTRPRGRPKIRWEDNIIRDLKEVDCECDWKTLAQDRVKWRAYVLVAMNLRVP